MITLGIDCGTQSLKTLALDGGSGEVLVSVSEVYGLEEGLPPGHLEQDPAVWWNALEKTVGEALHHLGTRRNEVRGIGISGQQHGFVPLNSKHQVIRAAKLWCDTSTVAQCNEIREKLGGRDAVISLIGNDMLPGFTAPKILWLKQNEPHNYAQLAHVALPHDFLNLRLTGTLSMEYGDASGTALLNVRTRQWSKEVCSAIDEHLESKLPKVGSSRVPCGRLNGGLAKQWGLGDVLVSAGGGDNMMAAIGTGNVTPGCVTASLGTSGAIFACADKAIVDPQGEIAAFCDSNDSWLPLLCTMNVTVGTELFRKMFGWDHAAMEGAIGSVPPGADGLLFLPYLQGERTPNLPSACGVMHGMNPSNVTPAHMARAAMEGVTLGMAYGLRRMQELGVKPKEIRLTGGGSKSAAWRQICADVFRCAVVTNKSSEGAALGAAMQALASVDTSITLQEIVRRGAPVEEGSKVEPREMAVYDEMLRCQDDLRGRIFGQC